MWTKQPSRRSGAIDEGMTMSAADKAVAAYDAAIFAPHVDLAHADLLAAVAIIECEEAAKDVCLPKWARKDYASTAAFLRTQIA